jgi:molybdopterin-binding protein
MKLSARNRLRGRVTRITSAEVISTVELDVGGQRVVATITTEAVRQLGLSEGQDATAIVKATDVMIAVDD